MAVQDCWGSSWAVNAWVDASWGISQSQPEQSTGGWENYRNIGKRKTEEEIRQERIRLGILPPDPEPKPLSLPKKKEIELTREEIAEIERNVKDRVDREIAIYLRQIEKQRLAALEAQAILERAERQKRIQQTIALVLILDAA